MDPRPGRRLTDWRWLIRYAVTNPKQALVYGAIAGVVIAVVTASFAIEAIPEWIGALVAGLALIAIAQKSIQRARLLWAANKQSTGSVTDGVVGVSGEAVAADDRRLTSKHMDKDCLAYESTSTRRTNQGQGSTSTKSVYQNVLPFFVDDGSGKVLVDASKGTVTLTPDQTDSSGSKNVKEGVIREGDRVSVYGEVERTSAETLEDESATSDAKTVITTGSKYGDVVVTDRSVKRVLAGQIVYGLAWIGIGGILIGIAIGSATGLVSIL